MAPVWTAEGHHASAARLNRTSSVRRIVSARQTESRATTNSSCGPRSGGNLMKKLLTALVAGGALAVVATAVALAAAQSTIWTASLTSGQEVPKQVVKTPNAHGLFKAT